MSRRAGRGIDKENKTLLRNYIIPLFVNSFFCFVKQDDKIGSESTEIVDGADVTKKVSVANNDEKTAPVSVDEKTTTGSLFSDESSKSLNSSSEPSLKQTSVTLSSND